MRVFQEARGLRVDGVCGRDTWSSLVESGFRLGDRMLYLRHPMFRGDDVTELQRRLNALGFDAGREDGILGDDTTAALTEFQRNVGLTVDGVCGPATPPRWRASTRSPVVPWPRCASVSSSAAGRANSRVVACSSPRHRACTRSARQSRTD